MLKTAKDPQSNNPADRYQNVVFGDPISCAHYSGWWTNDTGKWIRVSESLRPVKLVSSCKITPNDVNRYFCGCFGASGLEGDAGTLIEKAREWGEWRDFRREEVRLTFISDLVWMGFLVENKDGSYSITVGFVKALHDHTNFQ